MVANAGGAVGTSWSKSAMNSVTACSSADSNVGKDSVSPLANISINVFVKCFCKAFLETKINSKTCYWLALSEMPLLMHMICILGIVSALTYKKGCGITLDLP